MKLLVVVAGCCVVHALDGVPAHGDDTIRMLAFRELVDEPYGSQVSLAPAEHPPATVSRPIAPQPAATAPQTAPAPRLSAMPPMNVQPPVARQARSSHSFYGGASARATMSQFPRRAPIQPNPRAMRRQQKPFSNIESEPTLSPYLNLDRDEDDTQNVPNYFMFVRPQIEQLETNRLQQREIQQLRGQLQSMTTSVGAAPQYEARRAAGMGSSARFMDTAQFYGGSR